MRPVDTLSRTGSTTRRMASASLQMRIFCSRFASAPPVWLERPWRIDGEKARATVKLWITEACERAIPASRWPEFLSAGLDVFQPHPEVYDFVKWRFEPVTSLIGEIRDHAAPSTKIYLIDLKEGWLGGCDVKAAAAACDGAIICGYDMTPDQVTELIAQNRTAVGPDRHLGTGFRVFYPEMRSPADTRDPSQRCAQGGRAEYQLLQLWLGSRRASELGEARDQRSLSLTRADTLFPTLEETATEWSSDGGGSSS